MSLRSTEHEEIFRAVEADEVVNAAKAVCDQSAADNWPAPAQLQDELLGVQAFEIELLPSSFRPLVLDVSERMQTPPDYAAVMAIVALAGCVNRRAVIQPKVEDDSWSVVLNLWGMVIAPPGFMKSPVQRAITLPLSRIESIWRAEYGQTLQDFEAAKEVADLRLQGWREQCRAAFKKGQTIPTQPDDSLSAPAERRLLLTDSTFEKLHEILRENPAGVFVVRDELAGWFSELGREGREGERGFFLQAWNGDTGFTIDRIGRGSIHVPAVCVSLLGNMQPSRLRGLLSEMLAEVSDDGLLQRFQLMVYPDSPKEWKLVDRSPDAQALIEAEAAYSSLASLSADDPVRLRFEPNAQKLFFDWLTELEAKIRLDSGPTPALVAHLAKFRGLMPKLAALFELADLAARGADLCKEVFVSLEHARQAAAFCEYLESHAQRVYACLTSPEFRTARTLAHHIQRRSLGPVFTTRDVYLKGWSGLDTPDQARRALSVLEGADWARRVDLAVSATGGRPSETG